MEEFSEDIDMGDLSSIDDFIKELEAREKDLHISPETVIEIEDSDFDTQTIEGFLTETAVEDTVPPPTKAMKAIEPIVAGESAVSKARIFELEREVILLRNKISKIETERTELFDLSRRRQTDFDNYKKRTERDRDDTFSSQLGNLAIQILPVLDNLNRAMESASDLTGEKTPDFQQFFDGIGLVEKQLKEILLEMGVQPINPVGELFDPHFHEAVATEETDKFPSNTVMDELLRGYLLGDKVIRPAMVKVSTTSTSTLEIPSPETN
jgi:molecular chaperone GrpE